MRRPDGRPLRRGGCRRLGGYLILIVAFRRLRVGALWVADDAPTPVALAQPMEHASWRERRAEKHAERDHERAVALWQAQQDLADELAAAADAVNRGRSVDGLLLKKGEVALWAAPCSLIEPRVRKQGHYVGGYQGVSLHVAKGVNYRIGGTRGHYVPGPEVQTPVDHGRTYVTSQRVVFTGARTTREWVYAKLLSVDTSSDDHVALLHVSNGRRCPGLRWALSGRSSRRTSRSVSRSDKTAAPPRPGSGRKLRPSTATISHDFERARPASHARCCAC